MTKKIGVILSGCGVYDGAEIHESVVTLLAIDRAGAEAVMCAPNTEQLHVVNHLTGEVEEGASRNVLVESARIARGAIRDVSEVAADELDGLILPGGFGAAKNLCNFAINGPDCEVDPGVADLVRAVHQQGKPVAAVCIAPALLAKVLGDEGPKLTIGTDADTAGALGQMGAAHIECPVTEFVVDEDRKLITSPAYMLAQSISEAAEGIEKTVAVLVEMA
ncbi:MAG: isoprenoid biosynthesis glyoxalase ElbB [Acidobacteria bacterium]|jgi:enhancing lycopene biosynthesis protein 2|nr:isoprenoid biosynthesis glyoxalase ElbB [Acidobacteriota bacterium]